VKAHQVNLFLACFSHLKPLCGSLIAPSKKEPTETEVDTNSSATTLPEMSQLSLSAGSQNPTPVTPGGHHTMEFFEMCAALITQLAR